MSDLAERFWPKVAVLGMFDCWEYQGARDRGYGEFWIGPGRRGIKRGAHKVAWELANGPIPDGLLVCHHCDNPPCCNPFHLFLGTMLDNQRDAMRKGRHGSIVLRQKRLLAASRSA